MVRLERRRRQWDQRTSTWESTVSSAVFTSLRDDLIRAAEPRATDRVIDLGAGTGYLALALAPLVATVIAVDASPMMLHRLGEHAADRDLSNVSSVVVRLETIDFAPASCSCVVSSYALHHLRDPDKRALLHRAHAWLDPGGRLVIADMMFGRVPTRANVTVFRSKVRRLLAKGPGGVWRIVKNAFRLGLRVGEHPAPRATWERWLAEAGFEIVGSHAVFEDAALVVARRPLGPVVPRATGELADVSV